MKKPPSRWLFQFLGWLMGFEPTTTGITIQDSTAELQPPLMQMPCAQPARRLIQCMIIPKETPNHCSRTIAAPHSKI